jgi:hypothetical protein
MKKADIKYLTMINGGDDEITVHAYSSIKNAKTKALDYVKSFDFDNLAEYGREVSDCGVVLSVMSLKQFEERYCELNLIPEYELCMGY